LIASLLNSYYTLMELVMRTLHAVKIEIEYFDADAEKIEALLWRLSQSSESFSVSSDMRRLHDSNS
jgi:hypothetical protein